MKKNTSTSTSKVLLLALAAYSFFYNFAAANVFENKSSDTMVSTTNFGIVLNKAKVIYNQGDNGQTLTVDNPRSYPVLVQSSVLNSDKEKSNKFIVTPPLFRLEPKETDLIQIVYSGGEFPSNKESLNWLCVKGVPPKGGELWNPQSEGGSKNKLNINILIAVDNCIKLIYRPQSVQGKPSDQVGELKWRLVGRKLVVDNPTPFVMSITDLKLNGVAINSGYVNPMSSTSFELPSEGAKPGKLSWSIVGDLGNVSKGWNYIVK
ncbi:Capsule protein fraction 1 [Edwardsiella tarda]|uniref:Fimbria/pilus periplasmic chaperone n=1 Tax=Edwardsiella tarda ATCC 15947 = NBRC 105688 TaxID=667121 RepID=A0AC61TMU5_EDWTA|nr:fimbria/pilus periplasmic chaperone [Edwardsiella tarda]UAL58202.1 fimbria/pilus periplasmic chaperone [Edwardsiella tarda]UCQ02045.1 fimbria/pilus periplasmic chaperone [Edwardsiella tarda ATCC 15947 = NBRC 105688]STE53083.1 Capsule protein fraction 1 [Edwardsiella tarda]